MHLIDYAYSSDFLLNMIFEKVLRHWTVAAPYSMMDTFFQW